jgi:uncharacterized protein (TIGR02118 family)
MIKISVLYPNNEGAKFDMAYYCQTHIPLVKRLLGAAVRAWPSTRESAALVPALPPLRCRRAPIV